ncbi:ALP1-like protein [Tanacetum coccineum]
MARLLLVEQRKRRMAAAMTGTYYLCDAGYTNAEGFLTPYRGQRCHLNDWSNPPTTAKELCNKKHSSARNVIERCFGLIKARWAILRDNSYHLIESVPLLIDHTQDGNEHDDVISTVEILNEWSDQRDNLANVIFQRSSKTETNVSNKEVSGNKHAHRPTMSTNTPTKLHVKQTYASMALTKLPVKRSYASMTHGDAISKGIQLNR